MGVLIEYQIAELSNKLLEGLGIDNVFWTHVVANRFPDLEVRNSTGERMLRVEMKTLEMVAEEKSANFDTLIKDVNPNTDFVVVMLWEWSKLGASYVKWDSAPFIKKCYVFHAYSLATLRNEYWLNQPPATLGTGFQGFDLRDPVNCTNGVYSFEGGNYGKLDRIWSPSGTLNVPITPILKKTEDDYLLFKKEIVELGFKHLAERKLSDIYRTSANIKAVPGLSKSIGLYSGETAFVLYAKGLDSQDDIIKALTTIGVKVYVLMNEKYRSSVYKIDKKIAFEKDVKPKQITTLLIQHLIGN
jgi:hypothetical protein